MDKFLHRWTVPVLVVLILLGAGQYWARSASPPADLGLTAAGDLRDCESDGNCATAVYDCGVLEGPDLLDHALRSVGDLPRAQLETREDVYAHVVATTAFWGFRDDLELLVDGGDLLARSQSRRGAGDLGVNQGRLDELGALLDASCIS